MVGGENLAGDDRFCRVVVERRKEHHRVEVALTAGAGAAEVRRSHTLEKAPTGENLGGLDNHVLSVGGNRLTVDVEFEGAVGLEFVAADREQLHHLPGVVFIGLGKLDALVVERGFGVSQRAEVDAHVGAQRHILEELTEITKGAPNQQIVVLSVAVLPGVDRAVGVRGDENLAQGESHALAELVRGADGELPPSVLAMNPADAGIRYRGHGISVTAGTIGIVEREIRVCLGEMQRRRQGHLLVQPGGVALGDERVDLVVFRAEGRLREEARCVLRVDPSQIDRRRRRRGVEDRRPGVPHKTPGNFARGVAGRIDRNRDSPSFERRNEV